MVRCSRRENPHAALPPSLACPHESVTKCDARHTRGAQRVVPAGGYRAELSGVEFVLSASRDYSDAEGSSSGSALSISAASDRPPAAIEPAKESTMIG